MLKMSQRHPAVGTLAQAGFHSTAERFWSVVGDHLASFRPPRFPFQFAKLYKAPDKTYIGYILARPRQNWNKREKMNRSRSWLGQKSDVWFVFLYTVHTTNVLTPLERKAAGIFYPRWAGNSFSTVVISAKSFIQSAGPWRTVLKVFLRNIAICSRQERVSFGNGILHDQWSQFCLLYLTNSFR